MADHGNPLDSQDSRSGGCAQGVAHDRLCLADDGLQVGLVAEALRVDLVDVLGAGRSGREPAARSEEHTSELQSRRDLVCRLLLEKKKNKNKFDVIHFNQYFDLNK